MYRGTNMSDIGPSASMPNQATNALPGTLDFSGIRYDLDAPNQRSDDFCGYSAQSLEISEHALARQEYCQWLSGDLQKQLPPNVRPDSKLSLKKLGKKYRALFGKVKCVLIDLSGTLHVENAVTEDAIAALELLRTLEPLVGLKIRFVTNTTKESRKLLLERVRGLGLDIREEELFTSLSATRRYIEKKELRPYFLIADKAMEDFEGIETHCPNAVVVGLATTKFEYTGLNKALSLLLSGSELIGVHKGRYFQTDEGMSLGPGPFIRMLEFASDAEAVILGKPEPEFFKSAVDSTGYTLAETVMIGDDVRDDIAGAMEIGIKGILVQTGKYRADDETRIFPLRPNLLAKNFWVAVRCLVGPILTENNLSTGEAGVIEPVEDDGKRKFIRDEVLSEHAFLEKMNAYANKCGFRPSMCVDDGEAPELEIFEEDDYENLDLQKHEAIGTPDDDSSATELSMS